MHSRSGPLLRSIVWDIRMEASPSNGVFDFVSHPVVTIHGADGQALSRFEEDATRRAYRLPLGRLTDKEHRLATTWVINGPEGLALKVIDDGRAMADTDWRITKAPVDGEDLQLYVNDDEHRLAKGRTDSQGGVRLSAKERRLVWQAMQRPGEVVVFIYGSGSAVLLAPGLPADLWRACQNPAHDRCP